MTTVVTVVESDSFPVRTFVGICNYPVSDSGADWDDAAGVSDVPANGGEKCADSVEANGWAPANNALSGTHVEVA